MVFNCETGHKSSLSVKLNPSAIPARSNLAQQNETNTLTCHLISCAARPKAGTGFEHLSCLWQVIVSWLSEHPAVMWLEPEPELHTANFLATGIAQNGVPGSVDVNAGTSSPYADSHSLSVAGLQGLYSFCASRKR